MYKLYWIKHPTHIDPYTEGYIGITKRNHLHRLNEHITRRPDVDFTDAVIEILHSGTKKEISDLEFSYRPTSYIGWNRSPGGLTGGRPMGIHTSGWKHSEEANKKRSEFLKGERNGMSKPITIDGIEFKTATYAAKYFGVEPNMVCKYRYGKITLEDLKNPTKNRFNTERSKQSRKNVRPHVWWTNGIDNVYALKENKGPEGYYRGRVIKKEAPKSL